MSIEAGRQLHRDAVVVDVHVHARDFLRQPARSVYRWVNRTTMPPDEGFDVLQPAGIDAAVVKAVGDPAVTRWYRGDPWKAVTRQLDDAARQIGDAGGVVAGSAGDVIAARASGHPAAVLGVEGGDALGDDVSRVDELHAGGVRVVGIVHLQDNQLGTTCLPWQHYIGPLPARRRHREGLSELGVRVVERMQALGIVVDLAHADRRTVLDTVAASRAPVISSHTGARGWSDFARFLSDEELLAIAGTGGLVGLWPYNHRGRGVADLADLLGHARYIAGIIGPEHMCIGTDMNGVPGLMNGYRGEADFPRITGALLEAFNAEDVRGIVGGNFMRVLGTG